MLHFFSLRLRSRSIFLPFADSHSIHRTVHFALCTKHRAIRSAIGRKTIIKIEKSIYLNVSHAIYAPGLILLICYYKVNDDTVQISYSMQFSEPNKIASQTPTMITWWVNQQWLHQQTGFSMQYLHLFDHIGAAMTQCMRCTCIIALLAQCKKHATFSDKAIHFIANYMHQHRAKKCGCVYFMFIGYHNSWTTIYSTIFYVN